MDDPYYSHAPALVPDRPVALTGFLGARVPLTGALLSTLTGLPFIDLDRHVEHDAGCSLARLVYARGTDVLAGHERRVLARVLRESPPPIIALGHATLTDPQTRALLCQKARLIFIERPLAELHRQLIVELDNQGTGRCWPFTHRRPEDAAALAGLYGLHSAGYASAAHTIRAGGQHPQHITREILAYLEAL